MSYLGSKGQAGVFQLIIGEMPPHSVYVEPFLGSGKIFLTKLPAVRNVGIDADAGTIKSFQRILTSYPALRASEIICGDTLSLLSTLTLPADAVVYCDPPYVHSTRTSLARHRYKFEMTDKQHAQFLTLVAGLNCRVMISGYPSKLYADRLRDWRCISYQTRTRGRTVTECLWMNYPEPTELHNWRFAGKNFRERTALKRLTTRWLARLDAMPPLKRGYLLHAIHQRHARRGVPAVNAGTVTTHV